jgi:hypothetical protein
VVLGVYTVKGQETQLRGFLRQPGYKQDIDWRAVQQGHSLFLVHGLYRHKRYGGFQQRETGISCTLSCIMPTLAPGHAGHLWR